MTKPKVQLSAADVPVIRDMLLADQGGVCPICQRVPKRPTLDHQHTKKLKGSGMVRGTICAGCNALLGKVENNCRRYGISLDDLPAALCGMASYLQQDHTNYIHPSEKGRVKS